MTSERALQIRQSFDSLPSQPRRVKAAAKPAPTWAQAIFPSLSVPPAEQERRDNARGHTSPLGGKAHNWER
jgi:hypothetical protein